MSRPGRWLPILALTATLAACGGTADDATEGAEGTADTAGAEGTGAAVPGTPPGGLEDWVTDIRSGLEGVAARAASSEAAVRDSASEAVLRLYLSRQEFIERYYGQGGPRSAGPELTAAVDSAEARFHELMQVTGGEEARDSARVAGVVDTLEARLQEVVRRARAAGVPLDPPTGEPAPAGAPDTAAAGAPAAGGKAAGPPPGSAGGLTGWLDTLRTGLAALREDARAGRDAEVRRRSLRLYLDYYERIEGFYGAGGPQSAPGLAERVAAGEAEFHRLMAADAGAAPAAAARLLDRLDAIEDEAERAEVSLRPGDAVAAGSEGAPGDRLSGVEAARRVSSPELSSVVAELREAERAYHAGDSVAALAAVEHAYLEGFELLEPRLASGDVGRVERLVHLRLRPQLARGAPGPEIEATFGSLYAALAEADAGLEAGTPFWFGAFNSFMIILREGLEAVLLIAAILAYLKRVSDEPRHRQQVYAGVGLGLVASFGTWLVARHLIPVGGASRELIEGVTALVAVAVLLYVSHWLFHKTYVHDWKRYLEDRVGRAVTTGSALAMAALAFAAVYREGFETVLFYQALLFDTGPGALLAGFVPGFVIIGAVGVGVVRVGMRLPIKKLFAVTNAILLYLAFVFLGKGLYNLQEAGLFDPHFLGWVPDHVALRQVFGLYPIAETVAAQAGFLVLLGGSYLAYRWLRARRVAREGRPARARGKAVAEGA